MLDVWVVQQVAQTALSQCSCRSARADYIDAVFGYMPAHPPPHTFHQRQETPAQPCLPLRPSLPAFMHGGGAGLPCMQSSAEFLSAAAVQGLEFSTANIERRCSVALAGCTPRSRVTECMCAGCDVGV